MKVIQLPENQPLLYYLAEEQRLARECEDDVFFTWISPPTVICGRHQDIEAEVNLPFCREHDIAVVRRQSGGGCVYSDRGNLMLSMVVHSEHNQEVYASFLSGLVSALQSLGIAAVSTTHNDVMVGDRKVAGSAAMRYLDCTIVHSTLLYDVDLEMLVAAITPSVEKLAKHGVSSVRQRVLNLRELGIPSMSDLRHHIEACFGG